MPSCCYSRRFEHECSLADFEELCLDVELLRMATPTSTIVPPLLLDTPPTSRTIATNRESLKANNNKIIQLSTLVGKQGDFVHFLDRAKILSQ
mmetsp:Transcript_32151/g.70674  ORF Transcript_32151/g.70674 Transcript_32151/m.70674 type:complete len:93 (-) Transcript_32151:423-701(-)